MAKPHFVLVMGLLLTSCATQIQMTCIVPSKVALRKGSSLEIQANDSGIGREVRDTLIQELLNGGFYSIRPGATNLLRLQNTAEYTWTYTPADGSQEIIPDDETELRTRLILTSREHPAYRYEHVYSITTDGFRGDVRGLCHDIAADLQPHRLIYKESVHAPAGNPYFEQAVECCRGDLWQRAAHLAEQAVNLTPTEPETHYLHGLILRQLRKFDSSDAAFRKAQQLKPDARYTEAIATNACMKTGEENARFLLNNPTPFYEKTLPVFFKNSDTEWSEIFYKMNLRHITPSKP